MICRYLAAIWVLLAAMCADSIAASDPAQAISLGKLSLRCRTREQNGTTVVTGFEDIRWNGVSLSPPGGALRVTLSVGGNRYDAYRLVSAGVNAVTLEPIGQPEIKLVITFQPDRASFAGRSFRGFSYRYRVFGLREGGCELEESAQWCLGGQPQYTTYYMRNAYGPTEYRPADATPLDTRHGGMLHSRFGKMQCLDFQQAGKAGTMLTVFGRPALIRNGMYAPKPGRTPVVVDHYYLVGSAPRTPTKRILIRRRSEVTSRTGQINEYLAVSEAVRESYRRIMGVRRDLPSPMLALGPRLKKIEPMLQQLKQLGVRRLMIGPFWNSSYTEGGKYGALSVYDFDIAEHWGGLEGLRDFCTKAHKNGLEVFAFFPFVHLSVESPLLRRHPDWAGVSLRTDLYDANLLPLNLSLPQVRRYILDKLAITRRAGLDGLWMDSYHNFAIEVATPKNGVLIPQFEHVIGLQRKLQKMGFVLYAEGWTPLAVTSCGIIDGRKRRYEGHEYRALWTAAWLEGGKNNPGLAGLDYFRFLAFGAAPILYSHMWPHSKPLYNFSAQQIENISRWHRWSGQVRALMTQAPTLLDDDRGVLWTSRDGAALFSFREGRVKLPQAARVVDLATGQAVRRQGQTYRVERYRVYRILLTTP